MATNILPANDSSEIEMVKLLKRAALNRVPKPLKRVLKGVGVDVPDVSAAIPVSAEMRTVTLPA